MSSGTYDYIIAGMGCAGLSLAVHLSKSGLSKGRKILLIDREPKNQNNRTWCFWETAPGPFESIVHRTWDQARFFGHDAEKPFEKTLTLSPYRYKMIRGLDFFRYCLNEIARDSAFEIRYEEVLSVHSEPTYAQCVTASHVFSGKVLFNSILFESPRIAKGEYLLLQHFKGWFIRSEKPVFDPSLPTLMDFRPDQRHGTAFVYVMPFSPTEALIEYTLFTPSLLPPEAYDEGLQQYVRQQLGLDSWTLLEDEFGIIPMTNHRFPRKNGCILHIGTAGGRTKASTGYTFSFIQKDVEAIGASIKAYGHPFSAASDPARFRWYDSVLLNVLSTHALPGDVVFTELFRNNSAKRILRFLDNDTRLHEEIGILTSLPQWPFMKAGGRELTNLLIS